MSYRTTTTIPPIIPVDEYKNDPTLGSAVQYAASQCAPSISVPPAETLEKNAEGIMTLLGIGQCENEQTRRLVNMLANIMSQCTQQLTCMLKQVVESKTNIHLNTFQKINIQLENVSGSNITATNTSKTSVSTVNVLQPSIQSAIGATLTSGLQAALQETSSFAMSPMKAEEEGLDPSTQRSMAEMLVNMDNNFSNTSINQSVSSTTISINQGQEINLVARNITNSNIVLTNDLVLSLISENYAYGAMKKILQSDAVQPVVETIVSNNLPEPSAAPLETMKDFKPEPTPFWSTTTGKIWKGVLVGIVVGMILGGGAYSFLSKKKTTTNAYKRLPSS
jgi:hypothetical protein